MSFSAENQAERDALAKMNEAKIQLARENAQLKRQLEAATAQIAAAQLQGKTKSAAAPSGPRAAASVAASKADAEIAALRKEVATLKRLLLTAQDEHKRQLEAIVLEGVEHEERYRQLIVTLDGKIASRDKRIAEMRAELAAAPTTSARAVPVGGAAARKDATADASPATAALLNNQSLALQQILQIAQSITNGGSVSSAQIVAPATNRRVASSAAAAATAGMKREREEVASTTLTVPVAEIATEKGTEVTTVADSSAVATKRRGRPPGKQALAQGNAARLAEQKELIAATTKATLAQATASASNAASTSKRTDFGVEPIAGFVRLVGEATNSMEACRLASELKAVYRNDVGALARDCAVYLNRTCGPIQTREGTMAEVSRIVRGIRLVEGIAEPLLNELWDRGLAVMSEEACHFNHANQLFAIGYAIRHLVEDYEQTAAATLSSATTKDAKLSALPLLCISDFLCAYLHVRNRERGQSDVSYALPQLLCFLTGVIRDQSNVLNASAAPARPISEMVTHAILDAIIVSGEGVDDECRYLYQLLSEHAGWIGYAALDADRPTNLFQSLLAKLRMLTALADAASCDAQQAIIASLRPLVLFMGYTSITAIVNAFSSAVSESDAESAVPPASRRALMQLLATALSDFSISSASPDWATFGGLFSQFLDCFEDPQGHATLSHLRVCSTVLKAYDGAAGGEVAANFLKKFPTLQRNPGHIAQLISNRLFRK